ncbi:cytochrome P450 family protein [Ceratobasidium sp. AG-Ba]|nr:cytochrome P450 family protein [Ceratobasidium sp. AG-Ba]QRW08875.1 cytochrome P450 family protein [Ceratobasidium sp. AG-Ba]
MDSGLLTADLEAHKKQVRPQNPAFGALQIRYLVPVFIKKSNQLRDAWLNMIDNNLEGVEIDVLSWLGRVTLDIIGSAGFGYDFNSIKNEGENELAKAFKRLFNWDKDITIRMLVEATLHYFLRFPSKGSRELDASLASMHRIGKQLIDDKKKVIQNDVKNNAELQGRDLLTLLIKSNITAQEERSNENQLMSDEAVLGQISTFFVAGHETTSTATAWALHALTQHPEIQAHLRQESQTSGLGDEPSMSDLDKHPYIDAFVRETLRIHAVVPVIGRETTVDVVVPVGEEFKDRNGVPRKEIRMQKGDAVWVPLLRMNQAKDVWGEDAMEFKPERWNDLPEAAKEIPGVWGNIMTNALVYRLPIRGY